MQQQSSTRKTIYNSFKPSFTFHGKTLKLFICRSFWLQQYQDNVHRVYALNNEDDTKVNSGISNFWQKIYKIHHIRFLISCFFNFKRINHIYA